jgi:sugar phosphate isomerase/epimerase
LRLALSTGSGPLEPAFAFAAEHGITELELACQEPENRPHTFDAERIAQVKGLIAEYGAECVLHSDSAVNCAETTPGVREAVVGHLVGYARLAADLGCRTLVVHGGLEFGTTEGPLAALAETMREAVAAAGDLGVVLAIENMNVLPPEAEIRYLGCTAAEIAAILDAVPGLTACVDLGHAHLLPEGVEGFVAAVAGRIGHVQLTDNDGVHDDHLALGAGTLDVGSALAAVAAAGYGGPVAIELADRSAQLASLAHLGFR